MAFLTLRDIQKSYFLGKEEFPVLKGINLEFELGEFVSILGESGGGKSTLMNIIGGLDREFDGEVTFEGTLLDHKKEKQLDEYRRGTIGYIYQAYNLISHLTVLDNVLVSLEMTNLSQKERINRATELLERVGLGDQMKKHPNQLSGGQKQRVAIARALAADPKIIIADEPTGALDSQNTAEVLTLLEEIAKEGKLVIAVTHSQEVANHGTRIVHLADGKIDGDQRLKPAYPVPTDNVQIADRPLKASASYSNAFKHLRYTFWRNSLIMLGTAIGLFAVMLFSGLGNGIKAYIADQVNSLANPTAVTVQRYSKNANSQRPGQGEGSLTISNSQVKQLADLTHVKQAEPGYVLANGQFRLGTTTYALNNMSTWSASYQTKIIKAGTKPGKDEMVVDKNTVAKQYSSKDWKSIVGKKVTVTWVAAKADGTPVPVSRELTISGVADFGHNQVTNLTTYQTVQAANKSVGASTDAAMVTVKVNDAKNVDSVAKKINAIKQDGKRQFNAITIGDILGTINTIVTLATTVLAAIAGISLVVSALMIIVTMFMSVSERTKEIGILRALGESKKDVRRLFTAESLLIGFFSYILALILAFGLGAILNNVLYKIAKFDMIQLSLTNIITTLILAIVIAYVAALLPARRAAKLNPIDALSAD
ncbi:ABC transporter ATP-binding protein [Weissella oryzae SG25]|uniref:ABC transporter ATP-binding protein n=1 Tax=Weissella oryzae (strain DSM 25784 / JCM 18191 / LMG 30913 / SG25) TaxID=1329250 RepID=A0A069CW64_WEIOS|nr:ABC transporter ATP-binding protein/permease [Weissella oryzae]GAK31627.1 ABC transporter ATP-binding protein [Weissella oryzae SG25]